MSGPEWLKATYHVNYIEPSNTVFPNGRTLFAE